MRKMNLTCLAIFANAGLRKTRPPGHMVLKLIFMPPGEIGLTCYVIWCKKWGNTRYVAYPIYSLDSNYP
jgi:hypothetical protein